MKLKVLGSSSKGNCYLLENDNECLIIEAGIHINEVKKALDYNIKKLVGCVISHEHKDHSKYKNEYSNITKVFELSRETRQFKAGNFIIKPFLNNHDIECFGFFIKHKDIGNLIFATDTYYLTFRFKDINHFLLECNYDKDLVKNEYLQNRLRFSHMELNRCISTLNANDLSKCNTILLLHPSESNLDKIKAKKIIQGEIGLPIDFAKSGMVLDLEGI
ncbi:MAG: MBL fold metallo-hydrolase [Lachnospirales bacterium]